MDIAHFLLARADDLERRAQRRRLRRDAPRIEWGPDLDGEGLRVREEHVEFVPAAFQMYTKPKVSWGPWESVTADELHGRYYESIDPDPAGTADAESIRAIVAWCSEREQIYVGTTWGHGDPDAARPEDFVPGPLAHPTDSVVLRHLAQRFADHPDFRPEWSPHAAATR